MIGQTIGSLGEAVSRRWKACGKQAASFGEIAREELSASGLLSQRVDEFAEWTMTSPELPVQQLRAFGQPPVNLYRGDGFFIEGLVRNDGIIGIHDHPFSGAFGILHGSSIHARYRFTNERALGEGSWCGSTDLTSVEFLRAGAVRTIRQGDALTHSLFHIDRPTISVVVRTDTDPSALALQILFPTLLVPSIIPEPDQTRVALMQSLAGTRRNLFLDLLPDALTSLSPCAAALVGGTAAALDDGSMLREALLKCPADARMQAIEVASLAASRINRILEFRQMVAGRDEPTDVFLAVLAAVPTRGGILDVLAQRFGGDPLAITGQLIERYVALVTGSSPRGEIAQLARAAITGNDHARPVEARFKDQWDVLVRKRFLEPLLAERVAGART